MAESVFSPNTKIKSAEVNGNFANRARAVKAQNSATDTDVTNQYIQRGWSFVTYPGASQSSDIKTITLPQAFDNINWTVVATAGGRKSGSDPTDPSTTDGRGTAGVDARVLSTSQFSIQARDSVANVANTERDIVHWIAIGTKA